MASVSTKALRPLVQRMASSHAVRTYSSSKALSGGHSPPLPPFRQLPTPSEKLVENHDCVWDDGVAPELALDFDCQHVSSTEGLAWWLGGFGFFIGVYQFIKYTNPEGKNPAVNRNMNMVQAMPRTGPPAILEE
eukprot:CAMPEP_0198283480 /NCGR_PEP_ID=MMETSP1449-20131203/3047_1 /TAXON_ID=420275 /ORGANISM="Attheya septentrionalis, Strain CCMP2084" /LENGTH=133 /DNA_ID=CAMNT_0043980089 /DNA_START=81 /DNA_END=482 /DNA_ORIENTATION=-